MAAPLLSRLVQIGPYHIDFLSGTGAELVLSFASIGHDPKRVPSPEFYASAFGAGRRSVLFVSDESRSWGNAPCFEEALHTAYEMVRGRQRVESLCALGLSMGGFCALASSQILPVERVLAFGPQWSVSDRLIEPAPAWTHWTRALQAGPWRFETLPLPTSGWSAILHGAIDDGAHIRAIVPRKGLDHLVFAAQTHSGLLPYLKAKGVLFGLVDAFLSDDRRRFIRLATGAGAVPRKAPSDHI